MEQFNGTKWWADVNLCCLQLRVMRNREIKLSRTSHRQTYTTNYIHGVRWHGGSIDTIDIISGGGERRVGTSTNGYTKFISSIIHLSISFEIHSWIETSGQHFFRNIQSVLEQRVSYRPYECSECGIHACHRFWRTSSWNAFFAFFNSMLTNSFFALTFPNQNPYIYFSG